MSVSLFPYVTLRCDIVLDGTVLYHYVHRQHCHRVTVSVGDNVLLTVSDLCEWPGDIVFADRQI